MRLHSLRLTGIGPFASTQSIDFDDLASSGLFLIEGPTGSGKTTIIDALVYALFGVVSGGSDDVTRMRIRSSFCDEADPTGVACEFSVEGRRHRITRIPAGCRDPEDPARKAGSKGPRQVLTELGPDGLPLGAPLAVRKEVDQRIEQLLGMSAEQFRQLVVLPQGQFAELLRKTPAERLASLAPLLEDTFIARVQEDLRQQGEHASARRADASLAVDHAAHRLAGRLESQRAHETVDDAEATDFTDAAEPTHVRRDAVGTVIQRLADEAAQAARQRQAHERQIQHLRSAARESASVLSVLTTIGEARADVAAARAALDPADHALADSDTATRISDLRRLEGTLESHAEWEAQADARASERAELEARRVESIERAQRLSVERDTLPHRRAELEAERERITVAAASVGACAAAEAEADRLVDAARLLIDRKAALSACTTALDSARASEATARAAADDAHAEWERLVAAHRSGSAADLAAELEPGQPCPVCGSCEHPHRAEAGATEITRAELDAAGSAATRARAHAATAAQRTAAALERHGEASTAVALVEGAVAGRTIDELMEQQRRAREASEQSRSAAALLPGLIGELDGLAEREAVLQAAIVDAERAAASAAATLDAAEKAEADRQAQITAAIDGAPSATRLLDGTRRRIGRIAALGKAADALAASLAQVPADQRGLSIEAAAQRAAEDAAALAAAEDQLTRLSDRAATLASAHDEATPLAAAFFAALDLEADVLEETAAPLALAALVTAGNSRRLQLRAYALQRRFDSVLAAATVQLESMSSGRFSFVATDEAARGQSGLGIQLLDAWTGHLQDPRSLSGGETFYASLALALGLADVVRSEAGGAQLETLFVDEGFGSLDQDTLHQVLDQLDRLRAGNRAVGVVSHVTEMRESIPDRLEVRRQADHTSTIVRGS